MPYPWESCITLSKDWGWIPNTTFKTSSQVIALLAEVTAKGGNLLLGVGPTPEGIIEEKVVERLEEIGKWLDQNGKAIYETRITPHYKSGNVWFTADKDDQTLYAIYVPEDTSTATNYIEWDNNIPLKGSKITSLSSNKPIKWQQVGDKIRVFPDKKQLRNKEILAFSFKYAN